MEQTWILRMQEMTFPGFKFQNFSGGVHPQTPPRFMRGILATHVAFSHWYPPLIYYLTERSLFKKCPPPTGKSLKKALKNGVGVTVIGHNSESRTRVNRYGSPDSYKRKINYDISMRHIVALMKQSTRCEQFIKYKCYGSVIWHGGSYYAWWVSRQGSQMNYWGGAAVNSGKCACGMTNSCATSGHQCNCDTNDHTWREDSGYLTDKNTLPVTELRFGDTSRRET